MKKKIRKVGEASWVIGNVLCAMGNCLVSKSAFGLSAIIAPAFIMNRKIGFLTVGTCEYIFQGLLLALCCILIKRFKGKFFGTICNILFYGASFDIINLIMAPIVPTSLPERVAAAAIGTVITGFAVALMLRTYIPPSAYEIFVREVAESKGIDMNKMKLGFDGSMLLITIVMMVGLLGEFSVDLVGPMTVIAAFVNSVMISFFGKILDRYCDFSPAIPGLYKLLNPNEDK